MWCNSPNNRDIYELIIKKKEKRFTLSHKKKEKTLIKMDFEYYYVWSNLFKS